MTESAVLQALVDASIRALVIAAAVGMALVALRIRQGSVRHAAWTAVAIAMLVLPVAPKWLPAVPVALPQTPVIASAEIVRDFDPVLPARAATPAPAPAATVVRTQSTPRADVSAPVANVPFRSDVSMVTVLLAIWIGGAVLMLARFAAGWWRAARLAARMGRRSDVCETSLVTTPLAVGVFAPRILVPSTWSSWSDDSKTAVLLHEHAHIRRRDTLVGVVAHLNRCIFWFHPLAWWLERRIAASAEHACDDAVMRAKGSAEQYATVLLEMADAVRQQGSRVVWSSAAVVGRGSLTARVERILDGRAGARDSVSKRWAIALLAVSLIVPGIACQQAPPALRENPELAAQFKRERERRLEVESLKNLDRAGLAALEAQVAKNPDDLELTAKLVYFYRDHAQKLIGWNEMVASRRPHLLRMIEKHPESEFTSWPLPERLDPEGWAQARALWMKHVSAPNVTPKVLGQAARFFGISEKPVAEELLLRAMKLDPNGPQPRVVNNTYYSPWSYRLGELYARAIVGSDDDTLFNVVRSASLAEANSPFAVAAKKKLAESKDPALLRAAGQYLERTGRNGTIGDQKIVLGFDHRALGNSYLDRAAALDPDSETTKRFETYRKRAAGHEAHYARMTAALGQRWLNAGVDKVAALPEADQLESLPDMAGHAIMWAENIENTTKDREQIRGEVSRARALSDHCLTLVAKLKADPRSSNAAFECHMARGIVALRDGDRGLALKHLNDGGSVATNGFDQALIGGLWPRLTNYLLKDGERENVAAFMDKLAAVSAERPDRFADAAKAIRAGQMPESYQRQMTER